jgi:hypothetical protein
LATSGSAVRELLLWLRDNAYAWMIRQILENLQQREQGSAVGGAAEESERAARLLRQAQGRCQKGINRGFSTPFGIWASCLIARGSARRIAAAAVLPTRSSWILAVGCG